MLFLLPLILPPLWGVRSDRVLELDSTQWLEAHNKLRRAEFASDMQEMVWDSELVRLAQTWASTCLYRHRPMSERRSVGGYSWIGENLYIAYGSGQPSPQAVLENPYYGWYGEERQHWDFRNMTCAQDPAACEHFTQVVWAKSCAVGCAIVRCDKLKLPESKVWSNAFYVVCNYGPSGNLQGQSPFLPGTRCSSCPGSCRNGLCPSRCTAASTRRSQPRLQLKFKPPTPPPSFLQGIEPTPGPELETDVLGELGGRGNLHRLQSPLKAAEKGSNGCVDIGRGCARHGSAECRRRDAYGGDWGRTVAGIDCIAWSEYEDGYPRLGSHNFCRNPDADISPWCYVAVDGEISFDFCFPKCLDEVTTTPLLNTTTPTPKSPSTLATVNIPSEAALQKLLEALKVFGGEDATLQKSVKPKKQVNEGPCVDKARQCARLGSGHCRHQLDYTGRRNTTISGFECQKWTEQTPHKHGFEPNGDHNYCRIKGAASPWCFTKNPRLRWEYCFHICPDCVLEQRNCSMHGLPVCMDELGYKGNRSTTLSGKICQPWSQQTPHDHNFQDNGRHNFCRSKGSLSPWCFTTDPKTRWEFCFRPCNEQDIRRSSTRAPPSRRRSKSPAVPKIPKTVEKEKTGKADWALLARRSEGRGLWNDPDSAASQVGLPQPVLADYSQEETTLLPTTAEPRTTEEEEDEEELAVDEEEEEESEEVEDPMPNRCVLPRRQCAKRGRQACTRERKSEYKGKKQTTLSGLLCQSWAAQTPHKHKFSSHGAHNYCRIEGAGAPWCFTTDRGKRWEFCFRECEDLDVLNPTLPLPNCVIEARQCAKKGSPTCRNATGYLGDQATTVSGLTCQSWTKQTPHRHSFQHHGDHNHCRNTGDSAPWCVTDDPKVEWEYCFRPCQQYDIINPSRPLQNGLSAAKRTESVGVEEEQKESELARKEFRHPVLHPSSSPFEGQETLLGVCDGYDAALPWQCARLSAESLCESHGFGRVLEWERELDRERETKSWTDGRLCNPKESEFGGCWRYSRVVCAEKIPERV